MRIAVITANLGGIDAIHPIAEQDISFDRFYITDENNQFPFHTSNSRLAAKLYKICPHRIFYQYDVYVWVDANIEIKSPSFIRELVELSTKDIAISRHPFRETIGEEADYIAAQVTAGNAYLSTRYNADSIIKEAEVYGEFLPLYWCGIFARVNRPDINSIFDQWFIDNVQWTNFDQLSFPYNFYPGQLKIMQWGDFYENSHYKIHKHKKLI